MRGDVLCFVGYNKFHHPNRNAKIYKVLSHQFLETDYSIWVDGNITLLVDPEVLIKEFLGDADIAVWKHFNRDCIYEEHEAAKGLYEDGIIHNENVHAETDEQISRYNRNKFPKNYGLGECNVIIRKHSPQVEAFNNYWWSEICRWSFRDQLSFPYVINKFPKLKVNFIKGNPREHKYFKYIPH